MWPPPKLNLPPMSAVVSEFARAVDNPKSTHADLAAILDRDPALVLELLKIVNSAASGCAQQNQHIENGDFSVGGEALEAVVLTSGAKKVTGGAMSPFGTPNQFAFAAMQRAVFARHVRSHRHLKVDEDLAFAGALLQDFPVPALTANDGSVSGAPRADGGRRSSVAVFEKKRFWLGSCLAGARLIQAWGFPDDLICLVLAHHWLDAIRANRCSIGPN